MICVPEWVPWLTGGAFLLVLMWVRALWVVAQRDYFIGRIDERKGRPLPPRNKRLGAADYD